MADLNNTSNYPAQIDGYAQLPLRIDGVHEIVASDHNRLRNTIILIEQELGVQPSGTYASVRTRLDSIGDAAALINAHLVDTVDAHDASAISLLDTNDDYVSNNVEDAIAELAAILPTPPNTIGNNNTNIPNSGIPNFVSSSGSKFVQSTETGTVLRKTQPILITGIHIIEIGNLNGRGTGRLRMPSAGSIQWEAPGDSFGTTVDVSSLATGEVVTLSSITTTKKIRIARTSASLPTSFPVTESFVVLQLDNATGAFSINSVGITSSSFITRTAPSITGVSNNQFVIGGIVYPADKGTLVLQRKLRGSSAFAPIATLDLDTNFTEANRAAGQDVYSPSLINYDTITLYDRLPARNDYDTLTEDADGNSVYSNFDISATFGAQQLAKYSIPASNTWLVGGTLEAPTDTTLGETNDKVSAYRVVHYKTGVTDFNGEPTSANIYSLSDSVGTGNNGDNNVRLSNVYVDTNATRPSINQVILRPNSPSVEIIPKFLSGVNYYNGEDDKFDLELRSNTNVFSNAYLDENILRFESDCFEFVTSDGYGANVDVTQLMDDGYNLFSNTNVPVFGDTAYYIINSTVNPSRRLYPTADRFSTNGYVFSTFYDPFDAGTQFDAYGFVSSSEADVRILVNSHDKYRATDDCEYFTDESRRIGTSETFNFNLEHGQTTHSYLNGDGYSLAVWDSTVPISAGSSGTFGELQVGGKFDANHNVCGLIFPQSDYSTGVVPHQTYRPDYSADGYWQDVDDLIYQRVFNLGYSINRGRLRIVSGGDSLISFNGISADNASRFGKIELKIPGTGTNSTGWLDITKLACLGEFEGGGSDGGCMYGAVSGSAGDFTVPFTFQHRSTADNEGSFACRISYFGSQVETSKKKIMTMLQLLAAE